MATAGMVFPIPLPVILNNDGETPANLNEQKKTREVLERQAEKNDEYLTLFGIDSRKEDKERKEDKPRNKVGDKLRKQWDKLGIGRFFPKLLGKLGMMAVGLAALGGGFLSGLFNDLMELMLFAAVDPNGGLLGSFIGAMIPLLLNLVEMIAKVLVNLVPKIIKMFVRLIPVFINAIGKIINALIDALPLIIDALIVAIPMIFNAIVAATPKIVLAIMDGVIKIMSTLGEAFPWLKDITNFVTSIASAVKELFTGEGDIKTRLGKFVSSVFDALLTFVTEGIGNTLKNLFPGFEKFIDFLGNILKVLGYVALAIGAVILAFKIFAIIAAVIAAWPFILLGLIVAGLIALVALIMTYWDDIMNSISGAWDSFTGWLFENFDAIVDGLMIAMRMLLLPFTWPVELGWYVFKNWKKIKKGVTDLLEGIWKVFKDTWKAIKDVFSGKLSFGDAIKKILASAFQNIPGISWISDQFKSLANWISNSALGKLISKMLGGGDALSVEANVVDRALGGDTIDDRQSEFIKNALSQGYGGEALRAAAQQEFGNEQVAKAIEGLVGELQSKGGISKTVASDTSEAGLKALGDKIAAAVKSDKAKSALGIIKQSNTVKSGGK